MEGLLAGPDGRGRLPSCPFSSSALDLRPERDGPAVLKPRNSSCPNAAASPLFAARLGGRKEVRHRPSPIRDASLDCPCRHSSLASISCHGRVPFFPAGRANSLWQLRKPLAGGSGPFLLQRLPWTVAFLFDFWSGNLSTGLPPGPHVDGAWLPCPLSEDRLRFILGFHCGQLHRPTSRHRGTSRTRSSSRAESFGAAQSSYFPGFAISAAGLPPLVGI